jgi:hypothetical protein
MQLHTSKKQIKVSCKTKEHDLTVDEYARWLCLIEGVELVAKKAQQMKMDLRNNLDWIKPLAFQKYIVERYESMVDEVKIHEPGIVIEAVPVIDVKAKEENIAEEDVLEESFA